MATPTSEGLDQYIGTAADGATFPVSRLGDRDGAPVVLVPGMCDNRRIFWTPDGSGLANHLAAHGHDVWIVERRGTRGHYAPADARRGWHEAAHLDLPAAQNLIWQHTAQPAIWIGHSYGGVILSRALGCRALPHERVTGVVLVGSSVDVPLMRSNVVRRIARASVWRDPLPTHILGFGPEDEYRDQLEDMFTWCDEERTSQAVTADLASISVPLLTMPGRYDFLSPPSACDRLAAGYGSANKQRIQIARRNGFASNVGHDTLLMNPRKPRIDVFQAISQWITDHATTPQG